MSIKSLPARGLFGWDSTNEVWVRIAVDSSGNISISDADIDTILSEVQHTTYGLSAIETLVDEIETMLKHATYGLSALETLVDGVETDLTAMKQKDTSPAFDSDTDSLEAISEAVATLESALPADPADASDIAADFDRHLTPLDFWGDPEDIITISTSAAAKALPNIIVPTLPTGCTIWKVQLIGFISHVVDTSGSDNAINGAVSIQVKETAAGSWTTGYDLQDNALFVDVSQSKVRGGIPIVGNLNNDNLSGEVDAAGTYEVQITSVVSDGDSLVLYGLQFGLRIWIY